VKISLQKKDADAEVLASPNEGKVPQAKESIAPAEGVLS